MLYRLVVFDWEGTLGDTLGQILCTMTSIAKQLEFGSFDEALAREYIALGLVTAVRKLFPQLNFDEQEQLIQAVQTALVTNPCEIYLVPGALEVVQKLQKAGVVLAIASNKGHNALQRALQLTGLHDYFSVIRTAGHHVPSKPCPQMLEEIMEECSAAPHEVLMVGDSVLDIEMAQYAGVSAVGVDFYQQQKEQLYAAGALHVFTSYQQLADFLHISD